MFFRRSNTVVGLLSVPVVLSLVAAVGCTSETSTEPQTRSSSDDLSLGICLPLTCCFPNGGGWQNNDFEKQLKSWGCTTPKAYTASYEASDWWVYSLCPLSLEPKLSQFVQQYHTTAPYYADDTGSGLALNLCVVDALGELLTQNDFVQWDPLCPNCGYRE
jgi:hypothetical protein